MSRHPRAAVTALRADFLDVIGFDNPMAALNAIEDDTRIRVLITRVAFGPGKLNGVALARMVRVKRPGTKVVFVARTEHPIRRGSGYSCRSRFMPIFSSRRLHACSRRRTDITHAIRWTRCPHWGGPLVTSRRALLGGLTV